MSQDWQSKLRYFPLKHGTKRPAQHGWQQGATNDPERVADLRRLKRAGIACGVESDLLVIDGDSQHALARLEQIVGKPFPRSGPYVITSKNPDGTDRLQFYFKHPKIKLLNWTKILKDELGNGIDIRTEGGLVVAAGSDHYTKDGKRDGEYVMVNGDADLPDADEDFLNAILRLQLATSVDKSKKAPAELPDKISKGNREPMLNSLGCSMRAKGLDEETILAALRVVNKNRCDPPHDEAKIKTIAASCAKLTPGAAKAEAKPKRKLFLKVGSMATVPDEQLKWLKRHIILAAALNLFVGDPDVGKTLVAIFYIAELSRVGKNIIIICREDSYSSMWKPRLAVAGANLENIHPVFGVGVEGSDEEIPWMLDETSHLDLLEQTVHTSNAALCYIDPLADFAGSLNLSLSGDVRKITRPLAGIAERTGAALLVTCHTTKALVDSGIKTASGSFQLMAAVQSSWLLLEDSDVKGQRLMLQGRNKSGKKRGFKYRIESMPWPSAECGAEDLEQGEQSDGVGLVVFKGETDKDANDILQRKLDRDEPKNKQIRKWLLELLARGPVPYKHCNEEANNRGFARDYVSRICAELGVVRNGKTWALSDAKQPDQQQGTVDSQVSFDPETFPEEELCKNL